MGSRSPFRTSNKPRLRAPGFLPEWVKQRIEVNVFSLYDFMQRAGASVPAGALVLDAGAGEGRFKPEFAHTHYVGMDLAVGDEEWNYTNLDVVGNLVAIPFSEGTFDVVLCTQVLEHVAEPAQVVQEIARVLKPGGKLFLSAPQSWHQHQKPHDYFRYTSFGLRYLIEKAQLRIASLDPLGGYFWYLSFQLQFVNHWLFPRQMRGRRWTWPLRAMFGFIFELILPLMLFYLDPLDRTKDETFGYVCEAVKPERGATL